MRQSLTDRQRLEIVYELRKRKRLKYKPRDLAKFLAQTYIEVVQGEDSSEEPFNIWKSQRAITKSFTHDNLIVVLKARQLGISWIACGHSLRIAMSKPNSKVLMFSQGQNEANELIRRIVFMYDHHEDKEKMPNITKSITSLIEFENGSSIKSLPATKKAGRSFTASTIVLDEFAFMQWGKDLYRAAKPTIDNGGQLIIISSADSYQSYYHNFWINAERGSSNFKALFLPWYAHPDRYEGWRDERINESPDKQDVIREYPESAEEAFRAASGLIYDGAFSPRFTVTDDADYIENGGEVYWAVDDGFSSGRQNDSGISRTTGTYRASAHPRVVLLCQLRSDGSLAVFDESFRCRTDSDEHLQEVLEMGYPLPEYAAVDSSAAQLRNRIWKMDIYPRKSTHNVEEGIKEVRTWLYAKPNEFRRLVIHPRCRHLIAEFNTYRRNEQTGKPEKEFDHGLDALRYLLWTMRKFDE